MEPEFSNPTHFYAILGLDKKASNADIKKTYRKLALQYHPDKCKEEGAQEKFQCIQDAYSFLSDPKKRKLYNLYGFKVFKHQEILMYFSFILSCFTCVAIPMLIFCFIAFDIWFILLLCKLDLPKEGSISAINVPLYLYFVPSLLAFATRGNKYMNIANGIRNLSQFLMIVLACAYHDSSNLNVWHTSFVFGLIYLIFDYALDMITFFMPKQIISENENGQKVAHFYKDKPYTIAKNAVFKSLKQALLTIVFCYTYAIIVRTYISKSTPTKDILALAKKGDGYFLFTGPTVIYVFYHLVDAAEGTLNAVNIKKVFLGEYKEGVDKIGLVWTWIVFVFCAIQTLLIGLNLQVPNTALTKNYIFPYRYGWPEAFIPIIIVWISIHLLCFIAPFLAGKFSRDMGELLEFLVGVENTQKYDDVA